MFFKCTLSMITAATLVVASPSHNHERLYGLNARQYQDTCVEHHVHNVHILWPVLINQYFPHNESIVISGGVTVNINNAPTFLSTMVTGTSTSITIETFSTISAVSSTAEVITNSVATTSTRFSSTSTTTAKSTAAPQVGQFNLQLSTPGNGKRQNGDNLYVGPSGATVSGCPAGIVYTLSTSGQLSSKDGIISTNRGVSSEIFAALSTTPGPIHTGFSFIGNSLQWADASFDNGKARFCLLGTIVRAYFIGDDSSCTPTELSMIPVSDCVSSTTTATTDAASSTTSVSSTVVMSSSSASSTTTADSSFISGMLKWHNLYRANNGASPLVWDTTLATYAKTTSDTCVFKHTDGPYGENLAEGSYTNSDYYVYLWYDELTSYNFAAPNTTDFESWGHFSQVVWKATTAVGCGYTTGCPDGNYLVCEYSPPGNDLTAQELASNVGSAASMSFSIPPMDN